MLPDRVSNPGPLTYDSGALPIARRGPAQVHIVLNKSYGEQSSNAETTPHCMQRHDAELRCSCMRARLTVCLIVV